MKKFIIELGVIPKIEGSMPLYCDNTGVIIQTKESRSHQRSKHILKYFYPVREIIERQDIILEWVDTKNNVADEFTKVIL